MKSLANSSKLYLFNLIVVKPIQTTWEKRKYRLTFASICHIVSSWNNLFLNRSAQNKPFQAVMHPFLNHTSKCPACRCCCSRNFSAAQSEASNTALESDECARGSAPPYLSLRALLAGFYCLASFFTTNQTDKQVNMHWSALWPSSNIFINTKASFYCLSSLNRFLNF